MNRHLYPQIRTVHVLSVIAVFAISAGILLAAQSGCIGATLAGTDGSYNTPDTGLSGHALVQAVTAWEGMTNLSAACQIADTFADMFFTGVLDATYAVHAVLSLTAVGNIADTVSLKLDGVNDIATFVPQPQYAFAQTSTTDAFVTTWTVSADQSITINFVGDDMNISWGDGTVETGIDRSRTHIYTDAGNYTVSVTGGLTGLTLDRPPDSFGLPGPVPELASIDQWGSISWTNMSNAFAGASNMTYRATDTPNLSLVTDMSFMFESATAFDGDLSSWDVSSVNDTSYMFQSVTAFNQPLNDWDVSSVTTMFRMFSGVTAFNQPLNNWDVSSVTIMSEMFIGATVFNRPLNNWDVSSVTDMKDMFFSATAFNQPLNGWDVSSVITMNQMFLSATAFNQPLNTWDVSSVRYMSYMFNDATAFNQPINTWDVSSVIYMDDMFLGATDFDQDLSNWYVVQDPPVLTANAMFSIRAQNGYLDDLVSTYSIDDARFVMNNKTLSLNSTNLPPAGVYNLDITAPAVLGEPNAGVGGHTRTLIVTVKGEHLPFITTWRTTLPNQNITINFVGSDMDISWGDGMTETNVSGSQTHTYEDAGDYTVSVTGALTGLTLDRPDDFVGRLVPELASIDQWGGISWTNMSNAFAGASNMTYTATDTPNLSLVTDMSFMFESAIAFDGDLSSWDVSSVTDMSSMFAGANTFNQPLNTWDVSSVTEMNGMFSFATSFNQPLNDWDVSSVTYMVGMFFDADSFNQLLNDWDVSSVSTMHNMFFDADSFNQPLNDWDVSSVRIMKSMFQSADSFNQLLNTWDVSKVTNMGGMFFTAHAFNQPLNDWDVSSVMNMGYTFSDASSFNQPLNYWNVSSVIYMEDMFDGATDFNQNLGNWYVVPDSMSIARTAVPGIVGSISAQNTPLNAHTPVYTIVTGGDSARFAIVPDNQLNMISVDTQSAYTVNVTASDGTVFEDGNNWRILNVTVTAADDTTPPTLSLTGNTSVTISVDTPYNDEGATCSDLVDGATIPITPTVVSNTVDTTQIGTYAVTYSCTDAAGNPAADVTRTVIVQTAVTPDTTPPTLSLTGNTSVTISVGTTYNDEGATCSDLVDGATIPITPTVVSNTVDTTQTGTYAVTYSCADAAGNPAADVTRTVIVQTAVTPDTTPPTLSLTGNTSVTISVDTPYNDEGATCSDLVDGATIPITPTVVSNTVDTTQTGTYAVTYSCADAAGNPAADVTRTVTVREAGPDTEPPTITLEGGIDIEITVDGIYNEQVACEDTVDDSPKLSIEGSIDTTILGEQYIFYTCTDESNNSVTVLRTVTVVVVIGTLPTIDAGDDQDVTKGSTYTLTGATATDIEDADDTLTIEWTQVPAGTVTITNGNTLTPTIEVPSITTATSVTLTMRVTDSANPAVTDTRVLTIQDAVVTDTPPTIDAGDDQDVTKGSTYTLTGATATDIEDADDTLTIEWTQVPAGTVTITNGNTLTPTIEVPSITTAPSVTLTMSVTDSANPAVTDTRVLTIQDAVVTDTPPTIYAGADQDVTKGSTYTLTGATATDIEDADDTLTIEWTQVPAGTVTITNGNTLTPTIEVPSTATAPSVTLTMSVTDSANPAVTDTRVLTIQDAVVTDTPPTIYAGADQDVTKGSTYTLTGATATDIEDADDTLTIEWTQAPAGTVTITNGNTLTPTIEVPSTATAISVTLTMRVTDSANPAVTDTRVLTIQDAVVTDTPPTIDAGDDQDVTKGSTYTLTGATATDIEDADDTLTIEWTQAPAGTVTITNGNTLTPTIEVPSTATAISVTLTMRVTDSANPAVTDTRVLTIQDAVVTDTPPTIDAGDDQDVTKGSTYTLTGATATDIEDADDTLTIEWTQVPAGTVTITNGNTLTPTIEVPSITTATSVTLTMRVTDSANPAVTDTRVLTIQDAVVTDTPPTIDAGDDQDVTKGSTYTLTGAIATDIEDDDDTLTIEWTQVPAGTVTITNGNTLTPTIEVPSTATATSVTLTMRVTDSDTNEVTDTRVLTIQDAVVTDTPPTIDAGDDQDVTKGSTYTLTGATATDIEDADDTLTIEWTQAPAGTVTITNGNTLTPTIEVPSTATAISVTLTMRVTDSANPAVTDTRVLTIQDAVVTDTPPTIDAGDDQDVTKGSTYTLTGATATDIEDADDTLTIEWTQAPAGTVTITNGNTLTPTIEVPSTATAISVTLTMRVTDSANPAVTDTRVLTIQDAVVTDTPPTIDAGDDQDVTKGSTYTLTGATATDIEDDDDTLTIEWTQVPAGTVTITNGNTLTPTIEVPSTATAPSVTLTMRVTDSANPAVTDTRVLTIQDTVVSDTPPTIDAGDDQDVTKGSTYTLTGATATDIEDADDTLTIEWTQVPAGTVTITNGNTLTPTIEVPSTATAPSVTLTMRVTDSANPAVTDTRVLTIQDTVVSDTPPTIYAGDDQDVTKGSTYTLTGATATDIEDADDTLTIEWTQVPAGTVTITNGNTLTPTIEVPSTVTAPSVTLTMRVTDSANPAVTDTRVLTIQDTVVSDTPPTIYAGDDQDVTKGSTYTLTGATATDIEDADDTLTIEWTQAPAGTVTITDGDTLTPIIVVPSITTATSVTLTMSVTDSDTNEVTDARVLTIQDTVVSDTPPTIYAGDDQDVTKGSTVTLTGATATDNEDADDTLTIEWTQVPAGTVTITDGDTLTPIIVVPSITTATSVTLTMSVTDSDTNEVTDARVLTIQDVVNTAPTVYAGGPLRVALGSSVSTNPTVDDPDGDTDHTYTWTQSPVNTVTFSDVNSLRPTITAPASTPITSVTLTLTVVDGGHTVSDDTTLNIYDPATISNKKSSSSSSTAPIVDLNTLVQARIVDIPPAILEQISSHDASDPLEPILHDDTFDCPLTINEYCYLLDDLTNTLTPQTVTADQSTEIAFTVYTKKDLTHFTLYLNMQGNNANYADSDTYITYTSDGTVEVTDPHGYIVDATITVTQEDDSMPEKKTVSITLYFDESMGPTNMVAYMWNTDRKAAFIKIVDALEVVTSPESVVQTIDPEPAIPDSELPADPEPSSELPADPEPIPADDQMPVNPEPVPSDVLWPADDYDEAQVLTLIRMWSGFESEMITDTQLLELLGLEDYQGVDLPDWMMTELGVLVARGDVTVDEFMLALQYVLENIHGGRLG